jgi:hypothetical protein
LTFAGREKRIRSRRTRDRGISDVAARNVGPGIREVLMAGVEKRPFDSPDEVRSPEKTRADVVHLGATTAARLTLQPGWSWAGCIKPIVGTDHCELRHVGVVQSGSMRVTHADGTVLDLGPGDAYVIEPGHDAEVVGDDAFVGFEFEQKTAEVYARQ